MPSRRTSETTILFGNEPFPGVAPTVWQNMEPSSVDSYNENFGSTPKVVIGQGRRAQVGEITSKTVDASYSYHMTLETFTQLIESFLFSKSFRAETLKMDGVTGSVSGANYSNISPALDATSAAQLPTNALVSFRKGRTVHRSVVTTGASSGDSTLAVDAVSQAVEDAGAGRLSSVGYQITSASITANAFTYTYDPVATPLATATLNQTGLGTALSNMGLRPGQRIHIGSYSQTSTRTQDIYENAMQRPTSGSTANDMYGWGRVKSIDADNVVLDNLELRLRLPAGNLTVTPTTAVNLMFSTSTTDLNPDNSNYLERTLQFELGTRGRRSQAVPNPGYLYEYISNANPNTLAFNMASNSLVGMSAGFIAETKENIDPSVAGMSRKTGADMAIPLVWCRAFSTTSNTTNLIVQGHDEVGISTGFRNTNLSLANNISRDDIIGSLNPDGFNVGDFIATLTSTVQFNNGKVLEAIESQQLSQIQFLLKNSDGAVFFDFPTVILSGGGRQFQLNAGIDISTPMQVYEDQDYKTTMLVSTVAEPFKKI